MRINKILWPWEMKTKLKPASLHLFFRLYFTSDWCLQRCFITFFFKQAETHKGLNTTLLLARFLCTKCKFLYILFPSIISSSPFFLLEFIRYIMKKHLRCVKNAFFPFSMSTLICCIFTTLPSNGGWNGKKEKIQDRNCNFMQLPLIIVFIQNTIWMLPFQTTCIYTHTVKNSNIFEIVYFIQRVLHWSQWKVKKKQWRHFCTLETCIEIHSDIFKF